MTNTGDDETDSSGPEFSGIMSGMLESLQTSFNPDPSTSKDADVAMKLVQSADSVNDFMTYIDEHNIDLQQFIEHPNRTINELETEEQMVLYAFMSFMGELAKIGDAIDSSDDDNPFKVSDGDDPVY
jgi:type II secretory pathway component HofQ